MDSLLAHRGCDTIKPMGPDQGQGAQSNRRDCNIMSMPEWLAALLCDEIMMGNNNMAFRG